MQIAIVAAALGGAVLAAFVDLRRRRLSGRGATPLPAQPAPVSPVVNAEQARNGKDIDILHPIRIPGATLSMAGFVSMAGLVKMYPPCAQRMPAEAREPQQAAFLIP